MANENKLTTKGQMKAFAQMQDTRDDGQDAKIQELENHTHAVATTSTAGLMSATDKSKLDGIASGANKYTHPTYTARTGAPTANATPGFGGTFQVSQPVSDGTGHITAVNSRTITIPNTAAGSSLGLVKSGGDVTISNGVITVNDDSHNHTIANVDNLQSTLDSKADKTQAVYYIAGTGDTAGTWLGSHDDITEYYDGLTIAYEVGIAGATGTTLNINGLGAVPVVRNVSSAVTTHYGVGSVILLVYSANSGTAYWKVADYDSDTKTRSSNKTGTKMYLIGASSQSTSGQTTYSNSNCYIGTDNCLYSGGAKVATTDHTHTSITTEQIDAMFAT